jgi:serine/threonine-protein kinase
MYAVLSGEIRPPSEYRKGVPPELDEIVLKALQRNPDERWQSAGEMGKALRSFLAKQEDLVGPAEIAEWMAELFPNGEARKHRLMEIARTSPVQIAGDSAYRTALKSDRRDGQIPSTARRRVPAPPPLPASLLAMVIAVATVLTLVALDWLRQ